MVEQPGDGAVLVIRLWPDPSAPDGFRARIMQTADLDGRDEDVVYVSGEDAVLDTVRSWLEVVRPPGK